LKLGIYGDSYAEKRWGQEIWWRLLGSKHGHDVTSFGEGGSSIMFSAHLIEKNHQHFDLNIRCLTSPGRFSFKNSKGNYVHTATVVETIENDPNWDYESRKKLEVCNDFLKYILDFDDEDFIGTAIAQYHLAKGNVCIIPCFASPLRTENNLFEACANETFHYFGHRDMLALYKEWEDLRPAHFSPINNRVLAQMVAENLKPGVLEIDLCRFVEPDIPRGKAFKKLY
jgi:hypothetical protein